MLFAIYRRSIDPRTWTGGHRRLLGFVYAERTRNAREAAWQAVKCGWFPRQVGFYALEVDRLWRDESSWCTTTAPAGTGLL